MSYSRRLGQLKTLIPFDLKIEKLIYIKEHKKVEKELHEIFKDYRVRGEWFELSIKQLNTVKTKYDEIELEKTYTEKKVVLERQKQMQLKLL